MTNNLQHIFYYSSLIGIFYQYGIGCEVDEIKASKIFFNTVKNNQKVIVPDQFTFDISFFDIKELNEIITQYFYSLFLYNDIILNKRNNYKFHIKYAEKGDSISQYHIGNCYFYNINARRDYNKAIEWYLKSSEGGNIKAMYRLAYCYACGYGVKKDEKKAFELYLKSAEGAGGYKHALWVMGNYYYYGLGILKDENKAFEFYLKAAKKGHNISQYLIANYYYDGKYIPENKAKWFYWNRKAAINGNADAQFKLAEYYTANSSNKNEDKAFKWYMQLANKKKLKAIYIIAKCFRDGIGTDKNLKEATSLQPIEWYSKSSEGGNIKAMFELGVCYEHGYYEVIKDEKKAFKFYLKSAEGGYKWALYRVGNCYHFGECSTFIDEYKAFEFYLKAAEKGHVYSQFLVARWYYDGKYIPKNEEKGFYWNRKAAINGNIDAQFNMAEYYINNSINKNGSKAFKWYMRLANVNILKAIYIVAKCYRDGIGTDKNLKEAMEWIRKYEFSRFGKNPQINLDHFLNGLDIDISSLPLYTF
ncbi:HCP-like protein [Rhizophagus irregularis]|uniref:HCP-like protein n=2 Tax=Rhizophagus irregularis TaxID=588596 RepID=A0A2N1MEZ3_9GLOM|nr:HCP-like protein [Rhizophagus irregularis]